MAYVVLMKWAENHRASKMRSGWVFAVVVGAVAAPSNPATRQRVPRSPATPLRPHHRQPYRCNELLATRLTRSPPPLAISPAASRRGPKDVKAVSPERTVRQSTWPSPAPAGPRALLQKGRSTGASSVSLSPKSSGVSGRGGCVSLGGGSGYTSPGRARTRVLRPK